jgi:hypothetical protein
LNDLLQTNQIQEAVDLYSRWYRVNPQVAAAHLQLMLDNPGFKEPASGPLDYARRSLMNWFRERIPPERLKTTDKLPAGLQYLIESDELDEATDLYRRFAGVDQYTAQDAVEKLRREIRQ